MPLEFENYRPIYIQIVEEIKLKIISGKYTLGMQLPSVRALALEYKVNPNTVQRAFSILEEEKLVYADSTNGRFVTKDQKLIDNLKEKIAQNKIEEFINNMDDLGVDKNLIISYLQSK